MPYVEMYTTQSCSSCIRAKSLLTRKGVEVVEIDVSYDRLPMMERTGRMTVPQVLIDGTCVGGYDMLVALDRTGDLDRLLGVAADASAPVEPPPAPGAQPPAEAAS